MNRRQRRHSEGAKLFPDDRGPLQVMMATKDNQVVIEFGTTLKWFSMGVPEAEEFITQLTTHINQLKTGNIAREKI